MQSLLVNSVPSFAHTAQGLNRRAGIAAVGFNWQGQNPLSKFPATLKRENLRYENGYTRLPASDLWQNTVTTSTDPAFFSGCVPVPDHGASY